METPPPTTSRRCDPWHTPDRVQSAGECARPQADLHTPTRSLSLPLTGCGSPSLNSREEGDNMPRSFLVKKHQSCKKANYGRVNSNTEEASCSTHEDSLQHADSLPHHHRPVPSHSLSSSSSSSSCPFSLRGDRLHLPPSPNTSPLFLLGPSSEDYNRSPAEAYKPAELCTKLNLEVQSMTGDHKSRESLLPPSLPLLALLPGSTSHENFECLDCHKECFFSGLAKHKELQCEWSREKPFSCLHCSRAFADRSNLRAHLQTHSEVKKYQCASCFKTFSRISLLAKHQEAGCPLS
ncbi:hypothetical protein PAMP_001120 [Pampus punctatissimus]